MSWSGLPWPTDSLWKPNTKLALPIAAPVCADKASDSDPDAYTRLFFL